MNTKSDHDLDRSEGDPFALFNEWSGKADRDAYLAWAAPEPATTTRNETSATAKKCERPIKQP
ncbi:hypothetical protein D3C80_2165730 [compost metagenome]